MPRANEIKKGILRHSLNVLPEDSKTREIRLPERPGASSFTRYF